MVLRVAWRDSRSCSNSDLRTEFCCLSFCTATTTVRSVDSCTPDSIVYGVDWPLIGKPASSAKLAEMRVKGLIESREKDFFPLIGDISAE